MLLSSEGSVVLLISLLVVVSNRLSSISAAPVAGMIPHSNVTDHNYLSDSNGKTTNEGYQHAMTLLKNLTGEPSMRSIRPNIYGKAVSVSVDFFIQSFGPVNERDMDFHLGIFFRHRWTDPRLVFDVLNTSVDIPGPLIDSIWTPDLYFPNEKEGELHELTVKNRIMKVYPNGTVWYSCRYSLTLACNMHLVHFPMDYQNCSFQISSYSYVTNDVILDWLNDDPVEFEQHRFKLKQFAITNTTTGGCNARYKTGIFSCLQASFVLHRRLGYFVLQAYVPSSLIIVLSWVSFWINKEAVPARISLGVTTVLTMTTQLSSAKATTIQVSYPKALDVWYTVCMLFVFLAQIEFAFVNVLFRSEKRRFKNDERRAYSLRMLKDRARGSKTIQPEEVEDFNAEVAIAISEESESQASATECTDWLRNFHSYYLSTSKGLDNLSRLLFPGTFILFNLVYWPYYLREVVIVDEAQID